MCKKMIYVTSLVLALGLSLPSGVEAADPDLVGWWKLDDGSGTVASDSSGNGHEGTLVDDPQWVAGQIGGALHFDADGDAVHIGHAAAFNFPGSFSISAWINIEAWNDANWQNVIVGKEGEGGRSWQLRKHGGNDNLTFTIRGTSGADDPQGTIVPTHGEWHHVVAIYDVDAGTRTVYIDNVLDVQIDDTGVHTPDDNSLYIGARSQTNDAGPTGRFNGMIDDVYIFSRALTVGEIPLISKGLAHGSASDPIPADEAIDVPREVDLSWAPGEFANTNEVYLGTVFNDVNDADRSDPRDVLASQGQNAATYDPPGRLNFEQTYYWRVDEVNGAPDYSIFKGDVWSFTAEPFSYPITDITATATSSNADNMGPENTINGIGLNELDQHSTEATEMWLSGVGDATPSIQYEFDRVYKLDALLVWNSNQPIETFMGLGAKDVVVETSVDSAEWTVLEGATLFNQAPGTETYTANTVIDFAGAQAKFVRITISAGHGPLPQFGLSAVRFLYIPTFAREPQPIDGSTTDNADITLSWRPGREAASHQVYLGTDAADLALAGTTNEPSFVPGDLTYGTTYFWSVTEVNDAEAVTAYAGEVWSFMAPDSVAVDNFDQYDDNCNRIFFAWEDGLGHNGGEQIDNCDVPASNGNGSGSIVGNAQAPFAERTIVQAGSQSMPFEYDNSADSSSEIRVNTADLAIGRDWTPGAPETLVLWILGNPDNADTDRLYLKVNNAKVTYNGDLAKAAWTQWNIDLAGLGIDLSNVTSLSIGTEPIGATGGSGMLYIDEIHLYRVAPVSASAVSLKNDFEAVAVGESMHDVDGWEGWWGDAQWAAQITDAVAYSGKHALEIVGNRDDLVPNWPVVNSGVYVATAMQYVPTGTDGLMYFGPLSSYGSSWDDTAWLGTLLTNCSTGFVYVNELDAGTRTEAPLVRDQWVELRMVMNFDTDSCDFYYGDVLLGTRPCPSAAGFDIWPDENVDVIYYDDFRFESIDAVSLVNNFDALAVDASMHDVDGWEGWFGGAQYGGRITDAVAYSGTNALEIKGGRDDLVPHWPLVDSGVYVASVMQYVPASTTSGVMYFAPLRIYGSNWDETAWMADFRADCATGFVYVENLPAGSRTEASLIRDQWVQLRLVMNFDTNACDFYYGDVHLGTFECPSVQAFDIWPDDNVDIVYFDDFKFESL